MLPRFPYVIAALCAAFLFGLVGCRSGFRSLGAITDSDPFLNNDKMELVSDKNRSDSLGSASASADSFGDELGEPANDLASGDSSDSEFMSELDGDFGERVEEKPSEVVDGSMFDALPDSGGTDSEDPDDIIRAGFQADAPPDPGSEPVTSRTVNSGLGSTSPWGSPKKQTADAGVELSFEEGHDTGLGASGSSSGLTNFPIQLDNFPAEGFQPMPPQPPASETGGANAKPRDDKRWGLNIFGSDDAATPSKPADGESGTGTPEAEPRAKRDRKSIRDRFSKLGARFGLTEEEDKPTRPAPSVVTTEQSGTPADCIDDLIARTQARVADVNYSTLTEVEREAYLHDQVNLRLFYLADNQHERALDAIPSIPPAEQEFWQQMFWSLSQYRNTEAVPDRTERITQTVSQLRTALQRLQETARLQLRNVSFCRRIDGYGNYERFEKDVFRPGDPVLVYAEIENFRSEPTAAGQHRTILRSTLQILSEGGGKTIDSVTLKPVEDVCRNARRDYFNSYEFTIPNDITSGRYVLQISVDDQLSGKTAKQSVLFSVP